MNKDDPRLGQAEEYHRTVEDQGERPLCELYRCDHIHALVKAARELCASEDSSSWDCTHPPELFVALAEALKPFEE